jgi:hypothetical protein
MIFHYCRFPLIACCPKSFTMHESCMIVATDTIRLMGLQRQLMNPFVEFSVLEPQPESLVLVKIASKFCPDITMCLVNPFQSVLHMQQKLKHRVLIQISCVFFPSNWRTSRQY